MKKMGLFLATLLAICMLSGASLAEESTSWEYDYGNYCLKLVGELSGDVTIPADADGQTVNAIALNAFYGQNEITSLTMPDSLRAINGGAISSMEKLTSVTLNDGLEYLGSNFSYCNALTSVTVPASVRIVDKAFVSCENLKEIRFEGACPLFIEAGLCFFMMPEDYTIYVPDDQLDAYAAALQEANGAAEHLQPSGQNAIIPEPENNEDWFDFDPATGTINGYMEYHAYLEIPETIGGVAVKAIGENAFESDYSIFGIIFPEGLERIEAGAFSRGSNLVYVKFPTTLKTIGDDAFFNAQLHQIDWSEGLETIGARAFQYDQSGILTLPSTVKYIGDSAFETASCTELYLGNAVEHIGSRAFADTPLDYMVFDLHAPIDIASDAFAETYVADLDLPWDSSLENRDAYAALLAEQCPDCTVWINNPVSVGVANYPENEADITTIDNGVWMVYNGSDPDLTIWTNYDDIDVTALGDGLFKGSQTIRSFYPHHCGWFTTIGNEAFADSSVAYVEMFPSITTIGNEAFRNCVNLTGLNLPNSLTTIGSGALRGCTGITELTIPASLTSIGDEAFQGCTGITELTLPASLTTIGAGAFQGCTGVTELTLPASLTTIGAGAFQGCTGITELTLPASLTSIGAGALDGCTSLRRLVVECDPNLLPEDIRAMLPNLETVCLGANSTDEQVKALSAMIGRPWYCPLPRVGEEPAQLVAMPYAPLPADDFWYDAEYSRLDPYNGYELNLYLPREIDGVQLTMIGGGMMSRAAYGDDHDVELPVRSLVIPETYTSIPAYAFWNCDTLETVICYAPLENLENNLFTNCTSLREVIFVNGVRNVGDYVFSGCTNLQTVYLGKYVENIGASAFLNEDGSAAFSLEQCITDPAQMPDVDALLAAVKSDPMPEPTPEPTPEPAQPIGEEGAAFFGTWNGVSMEMDGSTISMADLGMTMVLTLNADGTATMSDGEEEDASAWAISDGVASMQGATMTILEDGTLCIDEDGARMFFARDDAAAPAGPEAPAEPVAPVGDEGAAFFGTWYGTSMEMDGSTISMADFGMTMVLTLNADGTATMSDGEEEDASAWAISDGVASMQGATMTILEDGTLCIDEDGARMFFSRDAAAAPAEPEAPAAPDALQRTEVRFIMDSAEVQGYTMSAEMMGGLEYSLVFHEDGTVDFVMAGTAIPGLKWTQQTIETESGAAEAYVIDYYGNPLNAVLTDVGFDMNYFDSMLIHFIPAE